MNQRKSDTAPVRGSAAINAAALQQHLTREWALDDVNRQEAIIRRINSYGLTGGDGTRTRRTSDVKKRVTAVVDTGLHKPTKPQIRLEPLNPNAFSLRHHAHKKEYVLRENQDSSVFGQRQKPTLAEKWGLVPTPAASKSLQAPDEAAWARTKACSLQRGDFQQPCPICQEEFGLSATVLLSCSHVFHKACLAAFERFSGRNSCPLCRESRYVKRVVYDGELQFAHKAATKIQAAWRGHRCRAQYLHYRESHPPRHPLLLKQWHEQRISRITTQALQQAAAVEASADALLEELDNALELSRSTFHHWDRRTLRDSEWQEVEKAAQERQLANHGDEEGQGCPICLCVWSQGRARVLLSCSHVFHQLCLATMEQLNDNAPSQLHRRPDPRICPLCRSPYTKKSIADV